MKTDMKELNLNEMELVNGGCIWCIAYIAVIAAMGCGLGHIAYQQTKKGK